MSGAAELRKETEAPPQQLVDLKWETEGVTVGSPIQLQPPTCSPYPATSCSGCMPRTQLWTSSGNNMLPHYSAALDQYSQARGS